MIKVTFPNSENQSAEYRTVVDFYKAIFKLDQAQLFQVVTDDCIFVVHGSVSYEGKSGLAKMLDAVKVSGTEDVKIDIIVVDKKHAAINAVVVLKDGSQVACGDILTFSPEQKIQRVDSHAVPTSG